MGQSNPEALTVFQFLSFKYAVMFEGTYSGFFGVHWIEGYNSLVATRRNMAISVTDKILSFMVETSLG